MLAITPLPSSPVTELIEAPVTSSPGVSAALAVGVSPSTFCVFGVSGIGKGSLTDASPPMPQAASFRIALESGSVKKGDNATLRDPFAGTRGLLQYHN